MNRSLDFLPSSLYQPVREVREPAIFDAAAVSFDVQRYRNTLLSLFKEDELGSMYRIFLDLNEDCADQCQPKNLPACVEECKERTINVWARDFVEGRGLPWKSALGIGSIITLATGTVATALEVITWDSSVVLGVAGVVAGVFAITVGYKCLVSRNSPKHPVKPQHMRRRVNLRRQNVSRDTREVVSIGAGRKQLKEAESCLTHCPLSSWSLADSRDPVLNEALVAANLDAGRVDYCLRGVKEKFFQNHDEEEAIQRYTSLATTLLKERCSWCQKRNDFSRDTVFGSSFHKCKRCGKALYCSTECQRAAWTEHQRICKKN